MIRSLLCAASLVCAVSLLAADKEVPKLEAKKAEHTLSISRPGEKEPLLVFNFPDDGRPYVHPLRAPDGKGVLTEMSPSHHKHQTGLYVGFLKVNGRDYFHNRGGDYFKLKELMALKVEDNHATWTAEYDWLGGDKQPLLTETERWTLTDQGKALVLDLDWSAKAAVDVTLEKYDYGGLFLRMPWTQKTGGEAVNSEGRKDGGAEGQKARWVDVGMPIEGRDDWAHISILDHKDNTNHPTLWRVDGQLGVGPAPSRAGEWKIAKGQTARLKYRLVVYTGKFDSDRVEKAWKELGN